MSPDDAKALLLSFLAEYEREFLEPFPELALKNLAMERLVAHGITKAKGFVDANFKEPIALKSLLTAVDERSVSQAQEPQKERAKRRARALEQ